MKHLKFNCKRAELLTFRRWGGKRYSLFLALNRQVRIAVLTVVYLYVAMPGEGYAQVHPDSLKVDMKYDLDEIEVSAQRTPVTYSQVARIVSVIDRNQIEAAPAASIQDLLEYAPGVDVRQRGALGVQADISVRGGSFDQTLILLNGINLSDPQTGHHNLDLPVNLKNIQRIEILDGPAARVYGPNAFSGAVNIITGVDSTDDGILDAGVGEHGLRDINLSGNFGKGRFRNFVALSNTSSNGYIRNTDFDTYNIFYQGNVETSQGKVDLQAGYTVKGFGANSFYTPVYPDQYEKTRTLFASVKMQTRTKMHFTPAFYWRRHHDRFELFRNDPPSWYTGYNYHMTDVLGVNLNSWFSSKLGRTALGAEFRSENIWSNTLGEDMDDSIQVPGEKGHYFTKSHSRTTASYFVEHTVYKGKFTASAGAMANWISDLNFAWHVYPGIDLGYQLSPHLKIFASANKSLRMPTFTDLYYNGPTNQGNPDLKPEKSTTIEGGFKYSSLWIKGQIGYYHRAGKDMIDWVRKSEDELWQTENLTKIIADGIDLSTMIDLDKAFNKTVPFHQISVSYSFNNLDKGTSNYLSYYSLDNLRHKLSVSLVHSIYRNISASWNFRYQDRNGSYSRYKDTQYVGESSYKPFSLVDVKVYYKKGPFTVYANISNLFDRGYVDLGNIAQPGRWLSCGFRYQLNFN